MLKELKGNDLYEIKRHWNIMGFGQGALFIALVDYFSPGYEIWMMVFGVVMWGLGRYGAGRYIWPDQYIHLRSVDYNHREVE